MNSHSFSRPLAAAAVALASSLSLAAGVDTVPGMAPVTDAANLYGDAGAGKMSAAVQGALVRVYVPNLQSNDVYVIDPVTLTVVDKFKVGLNPQHVVPAWDLKTLWVANNAENTTKGSLTPIDPLTGRPGKSIAVDDPYNMYFSPDGKDAIVVAEAYKRLDFRDPQTMKLKSSLATPNCRGINHAEFKQMMFRIFCIMYPVTFKQSFLHHIFPYTKYFLSIRIFHVKANASTSIFR